MRKTKQATGFSPVVRGPDDSVRVELAADHPGVADPAYRARRNAIAALAVGYRRGDPVPRADYTDEEHEVWRTVCRELAVKHERYACAEYLEATARLGLPTDRVPQLDEVSALLAPLSGFRFEPVAGLATLRDFYGSFAEGVFLSTQYVRHPSVPLYTPEPDVIHEVIGHANQLASPRLAGLYRLVGSAVRRLGSEEALQFLSRVFWFTLEFGVVWEGGELRTYGAGLLSSFGELDAFRAAEIRPLELLRMGRDSYDITHYQPVLYAADSVDELVGKLGEFVAGWDDDAWARLGYSATRQSA